MEIFGAVASALNVAALFNNCVDCFEYVQLARQFGQDYERCQLKVDIIRTRLSRWGQAVAINEDPRFAATSPADPLAQQVRSVLEEIGLLFESLRKASRRYEQGAKAQDLVLFQSGDMQPPYNHLHGHLARAVQERQNTTSLLKKAAWALYDGKKFERLIEQMKDFVTDLEKICPAEAVRDRLVQLEIEGVVEEPALTALSEAASGVDSALADAAAQKAEQIAARNQTGQIRTQDKARVRVGDEFAEPVLGRGMPIANQARNTTGDVDAKGESRIHVGNKYGGRGIFDD